MTIQVDPGIFTGGQMSQLPPWTQSSFAGTELMEVAVAQTANYSITTALLSLLINAYSYQNTIVTSGATYNVPTDVTRVLFNKTVGSATSVVFDLSSTYPLPVLIRDLKGDADVNNITITFTGGELCDGLATLTIANPYGGYVFNPLSGGWYLGLF